MSGVYQVARSIWDHPFFADEPYTQREAWIWMCGAAAWKPTRVRGAHGVVSLERGQLAFSERFLASKWKWSKSAVHRFLVRLQTELMADHQTDHGITKITICNYDKYSFGSSQPEPANEPATGPRADHERTKEEELKNLKTDVDDVERGRVLSDGSFELAAEVATICGFPDPTAWPPGWCGAPMRVQAWLNAGWTREQILGGVRETALKKRDGPPNTINYFDKPIASFIARQSAPVPKVQIIEQETVNVVQKPRSGNIIDASERLIARLADFDKPAMPAQLRGGEGEDHVRLLPQGRRE